MNEKAKKQARRAELEWMLLGAYEQLSYCGSSFTDFLEYHSTADTGCIWRDEAIELIALYGEA